MILAILKWVLGVFMVFAGVMHFATPKPFERIVPSVLPAKRLLVYVSGVAEILCGVGLLVPVTQTWAAWALIALFVAVFPANINMAINDIPLGKTPLPRWAHWIRLPLQFVLIAWAWAYT
ncbi:MAG: DoxX family protein [Myxococcaceae bacterium]